MHAPNTQPGSGSENSQSFWVLWEQWRIQAIRYGNQLKKRWWIVVLVLSLCLCGAAYYISQLPPSFISSGRMMVAGQIRLNEATAYNEEFVNFFGTQLELMQSGEIRKRAEARTLALRPELKPERVKLEVGQLPRTSIFLIRVTGPSAAYSQAYLDACMDEYISTKREMRSQKSETTTAAIQDELVRIEKEMNLKDDEIHEFQKKNNLGFLREEGNSAGLYLTQLNRQLADLKTEHDLLKLLNVDQTLNRDPNQPGVEGLRKDSPLNSFGPLNEYQKAKQQLEIYKAEREDFSRYLKPKHPTMVALDDSISRTERILESFRNQSIEALQSRQESIRLQMQNLENVIREWDAKAIDLSRRIAEYERLKAGADRLKGQYDRLLSNLRSLDVTKNLDQEMISILERASTAVSTLPQLHIVLLKGLLLGIALSVGILFLIDKLDDRVSSFVEFRGHFPENVLSEIPHGEISETSSLLQRDDPRHALLESFSTLRSSLAFLPSDGPKPRILMVTSAAPSEGKTTVSANFAITLARAGNRVLLVDADLRRGRIQALFRSDSQRLQGLSETLTQQVPWRSSVVPTDVENLHLLARGRPLAHPSEYLLGPITDRLLSETSAEYDYVVIDSAPVLVGDDALSLAPKCDGLLFVVRFSQSSVRQCRRALDALRTRRVRLLGVVCNDVKASAAEYGYYYGYSENYHVRE